MRLWMAVGVGYFTSDDDDNDDDVNDDERTSVKAEEGRRGEEVELALARV